jgi:hypothetical protein
LPFHDSKSVRSIKRQKSLDLVWLEERRGYKVLRPYE